MPKSNAPEFHNLFDIFDIFEAYHKYSRTIMIHSFQKAMRSHSITYKKHRVMTHYCTRFISRLGDPNVASTLQDKFRLVEVSLTEDLKEVFFYEIRK